MEGEHRPCKRNDMAANPKSEVIQHLRRTALLREGAGRTDGQLLEDYIGRRDEAALAALVHRHAPMVWGVCRRVLGNHHDAEDAFQATFLVLVRKAASLASPELLANWLYGVAHQTALKARATAAKRGARERQVTEMPEPAATEQHLWNDLQALLDQELSRLPDKYRVAIVLCDLEGKTRNEAARQLGVPDGTLAARLARGRMRLARRLARHGLAVTGGSLAAMLARNTASAVTPTSVVACTIKAASLFGPGRAAASAAISVKAAALADGVVKAMLLTKLKIAIAVLVALAVVGSGAFLIGLPAPAAQPPKADRPAPKGAAEPGPAGPIVVRQDAILKRMAMSPDGELVATVGVTINPTEDCTVKLWDARTGKLRRALAEEKDSTLGIACSRDFLAIAVDGHGRGQREVRLLDVKTLELKQKIEAPMAQGGDFGWGRLAFSPDGKRLAVAGLAEGRAFVKLWDVEKQKLIEGQANLGEFPRDLNHVWDLAFSPDGKLVAAAWLDGKIRLFDGRTGDFRTALDQKLKPRHGGGMCLLAFSPDSKTLASEGNDHTVALWDLTEPPSPDPERVRALLRQLDDDEFTTREKADRDIRRLGGRGAPP
jgi:RNA polymerase sigma factor (sigma-70 family)